MTVSALHSIASVDGSRALTRAAVLHHCGDDAERTKAGREEVLRAGGTEEMRW